MRRFSITTLLFSLVVISTAEGSDADICGVRALSACAAVLGDVHEIDKLDLAAGQHGEDTSLADLRVAGQSIGLSSIGVDWQEVNPTVDLAKTPAVLRIYLRDGRPHFISAVGGDAERVLLIDWPAAPHWMKWTEFRKTWRWDGMGWPCMWPRIVRP